MKLYLNIYFTSTSNLNAVAPNSFDLSTGAAFAIAKVAFPLC